MSYLSEIELESLGFASFGQSVFISTKASIYNPEKIHLGSNVRIDDFAILSAGDGGIHLGDYVHIAFHSSLVGKGEIKMNAFSGLSARVSIYSSNDDYSGEYMTNPCVPPIYTNVQSGDVTIDEHVIIGNGSIVLPNVHLGKGCVIGAQSLVKKDCDPFCIYAGSPAKFIKKREKKLLQIEQELRSNPLFKSTKG